MSMTLQQPLPGLNLPEREPTPSQLLRIALEKESGIEIIERITAMMERERDYQNHVAFDDALTSCQREIERIAPDKTREKGIKWATYEAIDKEIRPIYTRYNFGLSFSEESTTNPDRIGVVAYLTRSGITKDFHRQMPVVTPGQTSRADAEEAAFSRAQRYLVKRIFNITVGNDEAEMKPYEVKPEDLLEESVIADFCAKMDEATTPRELNEHYQAALKAAAKDPSALKTFSEKKNAILKAKGRAK